MVLSQYQCRMCTYSILLEDPLLEFPPLQHIDTKALLWTGLRFLSRAPLGFGYPPCAPRASVPQALFHAWNARGVPLTEPFALSEAEALSDLFAPVPFIPHRPAILLGRSLTMGTQAVGLCSSDKAVLGMEVIKSQTKPPALLRLSSLRSSSPAMEPASRFLPLRGYSKPPPIRMVTQDSDIGYLLKGPSSIPLGTARPF